MESIKETKELVQGVINVSKLIIERVKDGVGLEDAVAIGEKILSDEAFRSSVIEAVKGAQSIPAEIKDLDETEVAELSAIGIALVFGIIKSLKK